MNNALKSLSMVIAVVGVVLFSTWLYLRERGESQLIREPIPHLVLDALAHPPVAIVYRGGALERPENTILAFDHAAALLPTAIFWADFRPSRDGTLFALSGRDLSATTNLKGWVAYTSDADIAKANAGFKFKDSSGAFPYRDQNLRVPTLKELLERYPGRKWVLNFQDHRPGLDEKVIAIVDAAKAGDRVLIASPEDGFLRDLREKKPMWIFGTSRAQVTRLKMLDSIGIGANSPLQGDVFISESASELATRRPELYTLPRSITAEVHRRKMRVIAGPVQDRESFVRLSSDGVDGILVSAPTLVLGQAQN